MSKITTKLGYNAAILAARLMCEGARIEITQRLMGEEAKAERFAVRGAALRQIRELYYTGLTASATEKLRRVKAPAGREYFSGNDALLDLAGWDSVP